MQSINLALFIAKNKAISLAEKTKNYSGVTKSKPGQVRFTDFWARTFE